MSIHVHGQYNRAPFDGWAVDYATPGQYKDYYYPNAQNARTIWYHVRHILQSTFLCAVTCYEPLRNYDLLHALTQRRTTRNTKHRRTHTEDKKASISSQMPRNKLWAYHPGNMTFRWV